MPSAPTPVPAQVTTSDTPAVAYTSSSSNGNKLFSKKNILLMLFLLVVVVALPVGVYLVQKTQIFKSKAVSGISEVFQFSAESGITKKKPADVNDLTYSTNKADTILVTMTLNPDADILKTLLPDTDNAGGTAPTATQAPTATATQTPAATPAPAATTAPGAVKPTNLRSQCIDSTHARLSWYGNADYPIARYTFGPENGTGWSPYESLPTNVQEVNILLPDAEFTYGWRVSFVGTNVYEQGASFRCGASNLIPTDEPVTGGDN